MHAGVDAQRSGFIGGGDDSAAKLTIGHCHRPVTPERMILLLNLGEEAVHIDQGNHPWPVLSLLQAHVRDRYGAVRPRRPESGLWKLAR